MSLLNQNASGTLIDGSGTVVDSAAGGTPRTLRVWGTSLDSVRLIFGNPPPMGTDDILLFTGFAYADSLRGRLIGKFGVVAFGLGAPIVFRR